MMKGWGRVMGYVCERERDTHTHHIQREGERETETEREKTGICIFEFYNF